MLEIKSPNSPTRGEADALVLTALAAVKLQIICHAGDTEVSCYGVTLDPARPLLVHDLIIPPQVCTVTSVDVDTSMLYDTAMDMGLHPWQATRIWIHTHPGNSPHPSGTDEDEFRKTFRDLDYSVMAILARGGATYARLQVVTDRLSLMKELPFRMDWSLFGQIENLDTAAWLADYRAKVKKPEPRTPMSCFTCDTSAFGGQYRTVDYRQEAKELIGSRQPGESRQQYRRALRRVAARLAADRSPEGSLE